jgi:hypothetical protein
MDATSGGGTDYTFRAPEFTPSFLRGSCYSIFSFICVFCGSFCPFVLFLLVIVLSVLLRYTDFDYPFGIFNSFLGGSPSMDDLSGYYVESLIVNHSVVCLESAMLLVH